MALKVFKGELVILNEKSGKGRHGPWTAYSGKVQKADGTEYDEWISFGFSAPECEQGDQVVISAKQEDGFWKAVDVEVTEKGGGAAPEGSGSGTSGSAAKSGTSARLASLSSALKEPKIHYQNSRTAAIQLVDLLLKHNALPLSATAGKAGTAKRFQEVQAAVNKLTVILYHDLETFRLVNDIEDVYEEPKATAEPGFDGEEPDETDDTD